MTDNERELMRDIGDMKGAVGELRADIRTTKHDVANISAKIDGLGALITGLRTGQARGLGFFAGVSAMVGTVAALLIMLAKMMMGG